MKKIKNIIPIFIPHQGCGHDCIFCNQKEISGRDQLVDIRKDIEEYLAYFNNKEEVELAFYGGSFTGIGMDKMDEYIRQVIPYIKSGYIQSIRLSTRPDYIDEEILKFLKYNYVRTIELGVQSTNQKVLDLNRRGTNVGEIKKASKLIKKSGFNLGLQMMTGMYGSSNEKDLQTAFEISRLNPDFVRIYPTMVVPNTRLYSLYQKDEYKPQTLDETIENLLAIVGLFESKSIDIIRIGLYSNGKDQNFVGPFHPALKQLVYTKLYGLMIKDLIKDMDKGPIGIRTTKENHDYLVGYGGKNKKLLESEGLKPSYKYDNSINSPGEFKLKSENDLSVYNFTNYIKKFIGEIYET